MMRQLLLEFVNLFSNQVNKTLFVLDTRNNYVTFFENDGFMIAA